VKISITYLFVICRYGYRHGIAEMLRAFREIRKLGFRFVELEGLSPGHLRLIYENRRRLSRALNRWGLHVHDFGVVNRDLVSLNPAKRRQALGTFEVAAAVGDLLGAETLHLATYYPPARCCSRAPSPPCLGDDGFEYLNRSQMRIPERFDWGPVWPVLVDSCQRCADVAAQYGKTVIIEPVVGQVICSVDTLLRLIQHVQRDNFKGNFDTAHFGAEHEDVGAALARLRGNVANVHVSDNDASRRDHLPIGEGSINWREFFSVLKDMTYNGYVGLDLGRHSSLPDGYRHSVDQLLKLASDLHIQIEI